jgi:hypothetical protein
VPANLTIQPLPGVYPVPAADKSPAIIELEREILRMLCDPHEQADAKSREGAIVKLQTHSWHDAEHRIVFEAVAKLPVPDAAQLRSQLPAQATRMGFPDVHWETYFVRSTFRGIEGAKENSPNIATLIARLRAASREPAL